MPPTPADAQPSELEGVTHIDRISLDSPHLKQSLLLKCYNEHAAGFRVAGTFVHGGFLVVISQKKGD